MKKQDYIMLARRSMKEHKKSNRATIMGLIFGLILVIPMFTVIIGLNVSLDNQMNKTPYHLNYYIGMADYRIDTDDYYEKEDSSVEANWSGSNNLESLLADSSVDNKIVYEQYAFRKGGFEHSVDYYSIDGGAKVAAPQASYNDFSIIDMDKSNSIFPKNLTEHYGGGIFVPGYDQGFTNEGKKQVVLTENLLNLYGLSAKEVYLKPWSLSTNIYIDEQLEEAYLCQNYTVVGIIKAEVSNLYPNWTLMKSNMFFTSVNVYDDNNVGVLKPRYINTSTDRAVIYDNFANKEQLNKEYMMLAWNNIFGGINNSTNASTRVCFAANKYRELSKSMAKTELLASSVLGADDSGIITVSDYIMRHKMIYNVGNIISIICIIVGMVMLCSALMSFYTTIRHSVGQRKYYLTMMRAIGARDDVIPKLYLVEALIIASKANFFVLIIGFALTAAMKVLIDVVLSVNGVLLGVAISWATVVVGVLVAVVLLYALTLLFAYICTRKLTKRKITEVLNNK